MVIADIDREKGQAIAEAAGGIFIKFDFEKAEQIKECMAQIQQRLGGLHVLVNNAACFEFGNIRGDQTEEGLDTSISDAVWERMLAVNVKGYVKAMDYAEPLMRANPKTQNIYSVEEGRGSNQIDAGSRGSVMW